MTNAEMVAELDLLLAQLNARSTEMQARWDNPGGPYTERMDRQQQITQQKDLVDNAITHLQLQRNNYHAADQIAVAPVTPEEQAALAAALTAVSDSIAEVQDFQNFLALAGQIATQAQNSKTATGG